MRSHSYVRTYIWWRTDYVGGRRVVRIIDTCAIPGTHRFLPRIRQTRERGHPPRCVQPAQPNVIHFHVIENLQLWSTDGKNILYVVVGKNCQYFLIINLKPSNAQNAGPVCGNRSRWGGGGYGMSENHKSTIGTIIISTSPPTSTIDLRPFWALRAHAIERGRRGGSQGERSCQARVEARWIALVASVISALLTRLSQGDGRSPFSLSVGEWHQT